MKVSNMRRLYPKRVERFYHPFDDDAVINGQGTIALEVLEQVDCSFDYFIMSVGGGSMIASTSLFSRSSPAIPGLLVCRRMEPMP